MLSMKTKTLATLAMCASLFSTTAYAGIEEIVTRKSLVDHWLSLYVRVDAGQRYFRKVSGFSKHPKTKAFIGGGIGYRFSDNPIRMEFNAQNSNFNVVESSNKQAEAKTQAYMLSLYRDFNSPKTYKLGKDAQFIERLIPYVTAGVGPARHSNIKGIGIDQNSESKHYDYNAKRRTAWNVGLGMKIYLDHVFSVDIGFKYFDLGSIPTGVSPNIFNAKVRGYQGLASLLVNAW